VKKDVFSSDLVAKEEIMRRFLGYPMFEWLILAAAFFIAFLVILTASMKGCGILST